MLSIFRNICRANVEPLSNRCRTLVEPRFVFAIANDANLCFITPFVVSILAGFSRFPPQILPEFSPKSPSSIACSIVFVVILDACSMFFRDIFDAYSIAQEVFLSRSGRYFCHACRSRVVLPTTLPEFCFSKTKRFASILLKQNQTACLTKS